MVSTAIFAEKLRIDGIEPCNTCKWANDYYNIITEFKCNYIICIQIDISLYRKTVGVIVARTVNPVSFNHIKD